MIKATENPEDKSKEEEKKEEVKYVCKKCRKFVFSSSALES
jgi:hypothetical protein